MPKIFLLYFPFCFVGKFMERKIRYLPFQPNNANPRLYRPDNPKTPRTRLAPTCVIEGDVEVHGAIDNSDDRAGDTGHERRVDATWVSVVMCAC